MNNLVEDHPCGLFCYFHPREAVIGVCAACLKEKLIVLASKQGRLSPAGKGHGAFSRIPSLKPSVSMPKVFALGSSLLHRLESRHQKPGEDSDGDSIASADDSFISIKFEDNGQVSWDKMAAAGERWGGQAVPAGEPTYHGAPSGGGSGCGGCFISCGGSGRPRRAAARATAQAGPAEWAPLRGWAGYGA